MHVQLSARISALEAESAATRRVVLAMSQLLVAVGEKVSFPADVEHLVQHVQQYVERCTTDASAKPSSPTAALA
jgi:hypothetical protein